VILPPAAKDLGFTLEEIKAAARARAGAAGDAAEQEAEGGDSVGDGDGAVAVGIGAPEEACGRRLRAEGNDQLFSQLLRLERKTAGIALVEERVGRAGRAPGSNHDA
jgi:hypothetical protein